MAGMQAGGFGSVVMRQLRVMEIALDDLRYWARTDSKKYQRIKTMLEQLCANPKASIGKPEPLKGDKAGLWSCRIDKQNRLIYSFDEEFIYIGVLDDSYSYIR
jgi:toxin YoeB